MFSILFKYYFFIHYLFFFQQLHIFQYFFIQYPIIIIEKNIWRMNNIAHQTWWATVHETKKIPSIESPLKTIFMVPLSIIEIFMHLITPLEMLLECTGEGCTLTPSPVHSKMCKASNLWQLHIIFSIITNILLQYIKLIIMIKRKILYLHCKYNI